MQQNIILVGITPEELVSKIANTLKAQSNTPSHKTATDKPDKTYLTRSETISILKITLPTLHLWTKHKVLKSYKIGRRVLYKLSEIDEAIAGNHFSNPLKRRK